MWLMPPWVPMPRQTAADRQAFKENEGFSPPPERYLLPLRQLYDSA